MKIVFVVIDDTLLQSMLELLLFFGQLCLDFFGPGIFFHKVYVYIVDRSYASIVESVWILQPLKVFILPPLT